MKRRELLRHLENNGCVFFREGRRPTVYYSPSSRKTSVVPRHTEIGEALAKKICKDLEVHPPG